MSESREIWCLATQGTGSLDEQRLHELLTPLGPVRRPFARDHKARSALRLLYDLARRRPTLVVVEGTGIAVGLPLILARLCGWTRYAVSSGDAVAPFLALRSPLLVPIGGLYERALYRLCAGFIGWTPYLVGRALTYGAPRAATAENWARAGATATEGARIRGRLGIPADAVVHGLVGNLTWTPRRGYCYGHELIRALRHCDRRDVRVLIVGDGTGRAELERLLRQHPDDRVHLTGAVPAAEVPAYLAAMDVASLPQSVDGVGAFRYTTKLSEYLAAGLPVVTGQLPFAYDLDEGWLWRLPGDAPWQEVYERAYGQLMRRLTREEIAPRAAQTVRGRAHFDGAAQQRRICAFVVDLRDQAGEEAG
jgi:hypothetical protein